MKREDLRKLLDVALEARVAAIAAAEEDFKREELRCRERVAQAHRDFYKEQDRLYKLAEAEGWSP